MAKTYYKIGDIIRFKWGKDELTGEIRSITAGWKKEKDWSGETGLCYLTYTTYANGHGRWVNPHSII